MTRPRTVIDYAPPRRSVVSNLADRSAGTLRYLGWFVWRRPLQAHEVFIGCWLALAALWVVAALETLREGYVFVPSHMLMSFAAALITVAAAGLVRTVLRARWWALLICVAVALPAGAASGLLQYDRCPHAVYVQVVGASIPITDRPCRNSRDVAPWWMQRLERACRLAHLPTRTLTDTLIIP